MKKVIVTILTSILAATFCFSQDIITMKTGEDILAKLTDVTTTEIKYKKFDNQNGPTFSILRADVLMIRYEDGSKDIFTETTNKPSVNDIANKGIQDAMTNYKGKNSGTGWTVATTILFTPLIGIIPAVACAAKTPSDHNLDYKDAELMNDYLYNMSYKKTAHRTKKKKVWLGFGLASVLWLVIVTANQ
jgi:hypothetical protein